MLVRYIVFGPIVAAACCAMLLMADIAIVPSLLISWFVGSGAVAVLAVSSVYCNRSAAESTEQDEPETKRSSGDNVPTSG